MQKMQNTDVRALEGPGLKQIFSTHAIPTKLIGESRKGGKIIYTDGGGDKGPRNRGGTRASPRGPADGIPSHFAELPLFLLLNLSFTMIIEENYHGGHLTL